MPSLTSRQDLPATLSLRVVTDCAAEEKRSASPLEDDDAWDASRHPDCSPTSDDERSAVIPTTAELTPLDDATPAAIQYALQSLATQPEDWLLQHEAITALRRALVHHTALLTTGNHEDPLVPALVVASDNLRSALSKNALLALSECFACLGLSRLRSFLLPLERGTVPLVDVLLRRATCEKRFLRDAAREAIDRLLEHLASPELIAAAAGYATNKNAKIVAIASKLMAQSFARLRADGTQWDVEQFAYHDGTSPSVVYEALAKFRAGKDSAARAESLACLRLLGESLGRERFEATLQQALAASQRHSVTSIVGEVFPPVAAAAGPSGRRGSLKDRVLLQQQQSTTN